MIETGHNVLMMLGSSQEPMLSAGEEYRAAIGRAFDALPEGTRAEIVDGEIIVSPLRLNAHERVTMYLNSLIVPVTNPLDWWVDTSGGVILEPDWDEYRPDLQVAPVSPGTPRRPARWCRR